MVGRVTAGRGLEAAGRVEEEDCLFTSLTTVFQRIGFFPSLLSSKLLSVGRSGFDFAPCEGRIRS